jgi:hypothetical protein
MKPDRKLKSMIAKKQENTILRSNLHWLVSIKTKGVAMIFCWGGPDFKPQTNDR